MTTEPFTLPSCPADEALTLHLNIFTAIGRGAYVELKPAARTQNNDMFSSSSAPGGKHGSPSLRSTQIIGGGVDLVAEWLQMPSNDTTPKTELEWVNGGCASTFYRQIPVNIDISQSFSLTFLIVISGAYQAQLRNKSLPAGGCDGGNYHEPCKTVKDCLCYVQPGSSAVHCNKIPGTCQGVHTQCLGGICQAPNVTGGEACGQRKEVTIEPPAVSVGADLSKLFGVKEEVVVSLSMWASELYSLQFVCGGGGAGGVATGVV